MDPSIHLPMLDTFGLQGLLTRSWSLKVIETEDSKTAEACNSAEANNLKRLRVDEPEAGSVDWKVSRQQWGMGPMQDRAFRMLPTELKTQLRG